MYMKRRSLSERLPLVELINVPTASFQSFGHIGGVYLMGYMSAAAEILPQDHFFDYLEGLPALHKTVRTVRIWKKWAVGQTEPRLDPRYNEGVDVFPAVSFFPQKFTHIQFLC